MKNIVSFEDFVNKETSVKIHEYLFHDASKESYQKMRTGVKYKDEYSLVDVDELSEYMWLKPSITTLEYDIFVDDGEAHIRGNHILLLFVRNGKTKSCNEFIPISVSNDPKILDFDINITISPEDMYDIRNFIIINKNLLIKMSKGRILPDDFIDNLKVPSLELEEGYFLLNEMATVSTQLTNLPMTIWVDEGATFQGHAPRIKFKASKEQRNTREFSTMTLTKPPKIENLPPRHDLSKRDIEKLEEFVLNNLENLLKLANCEIDYRKDFLPNIVKCGNQKEVNNNDKEK